MDRYKIENDLLIGDPKIKDVHRAILHSGIAILDSLKTIENMLEAEYNKNNFVTYSLDESND